MKKKISRSIYGLSGWLKFNMIIDLLGNKLKITKVQGDPSTAIPKFLISGQILKDLSKNELKRQLFVHTFKIVHQKTLMVFRGVGYFKNKVGMARNLHVFGLNYTKKGKIFRKTHLIEKFAP